MTKPLVFNYREYDTLRDKANDMAVEIADLRDKVKRLETDNKMLESINKIQHNTIETYQQIFKLQEAELERLRHDSKL